LGRKQRRVYVLSLQEGLYRKSCIRGAHLPKSEMGKSVGWVRGGRTVAGSFIT